LLDNFGNYGNTAWIGLERHVPEIYPFEGFPSDRPHIPAKLFDRTVNHLNIHRQTAILLNQRIWSVPKSPPVGLPSSLAKTWIANIRS